MAKGHREHRSVKAESDVLKDTEAKAKAETANEHDVLTHTEAMAKAVEDKVREAAQRTIAEAKPAVAAERLVQMAEAELVHQEVAEAAKVRVQEERVEAVKEAIQHPIQAAKQSFRHPLEAARRAGMEVADGLVAKAEKRLAALPEPVKKLGRLAEKVADAALWPARFGLRLAGELLRTPITLGRILFRRSRTA